MTETPNLGLSQWSLNDLIKMADFNSDNLKLDNFGRLNSGLGNEYVWAKYAVETVEMHDTATAASNTLVCSVATVFYYAETFHIENGLFVLDNPVAIQNAYESNVDLSGATGKYCIDGGKTTSGSIMYLMSGGIGRSGTDILLAGQGTKYSNIRNEDVERFAGYVNSPDPSAYPVDDGFTYTALGQMGNKVQMATGSYAATGTYGSNNPCSLTFDFVPKIFAIAVQYSPNHQSNSQIFVLPKADGGAALNYGGSCSISTWEYTKKVYTYASADGKTVYWYSADNATAQMNQSGFTYAYFAIG